MIVKRKEEKTKDMPSEVIYHYRKKIRMVRQNPMLCLHLESVGRFCKLDGLGCELCLGLSYVCIDYNTQEEEVNGTGTEQGCDEEK